MKEFKIIFLAVIALFLAIVFTYARFNYLQQQLIREEVNSVKTDVDNLISSLRDTDSQLQNYVENMKKFEDRVNSGTAERKDILTKIESLTKDIQNLQANLTISGTEAQKKVIELGTVPVKKKKK
jgi:septal ring factor EnvC (AmiA/AmiB activator)